MTALRTPVEWNGPPPQRVVLQSLTIPQEVAVTAAIVHVHSILAVARYGNRAGVGKTLNATCSCGGGSEAGAGVGGYWYDGKGGSATQTQGGWRLSWDRMATIVLAGLTPGFVQHLVAGFRLHCNLHYDEWGQINAVNDSLAYRTTWWPTYMRASRVMREAEAAIFERAEVILDPPTVQQLALL